MLRFENETFAVINSRQRLGFIGREVLLPHMLILHLFRVYLQGCKIDKMCQLLLPLSLILNLSRFMIFLLNVCLCNIRPNH
jgi:hypothetical protein